MNIEFDSAKNEKNIRERGISFELAAGFDLTTAKIWADTRKDYGEARFIALGYIGIDYIQWCLRCAVMCYAL